VATITPIIEMRQKNPNTGVGTKIELKPLIFSAAGLQHTILALCYANNSPAQTYIAPIWDRTTSMPERQCLRISDHLLSNLNHVAKGS
jgi:hypothetical protein